MKARLLGTSLLLSLAGTLLLPQLARANIDDEEAADGSTNAPGHSLHGEAFNEGPRQAAVLMPGTGHVELLVTTSVPAAQAFFDQGVGQLEGFWYFEAERSFRQVAALDTNCAMAYWGMAMANVYNSNRAAGFIQAATDRKTNAGPREVMWIEAYQAYFGTNETKKSATDRRKDLVLALESIVEKYPDELEAKAFLAFQIWENESRGIPITSRLSVDALATQVLEVEPLHPVHHARIHLWNYNKDEMALNSAARCGQSAPGIAHMWHMPGHTYSALKRYDDAAWQQEASARTDHAYMEEARILPDQIHNFAHNNQWLCTDLLYCGRVHDAIALARNMVELPRHPKYNTLNRKEDTTAYDKNNGSSMLGRNRLFDAFLQFEMWPDMLELADTFYLEPTDLPEEMGRRYYALALAQLAKNDTDAARQLSGSLDDCLKQLKHERFDAVEKAEAEARKKEANTHDAMLKALEGFDHRLDIVDAWRNELKIRLLLADGSTNDALGLIKQTKGIDREQRARLWQLAGDTTNTVKLAGELIENGSNQAPSLALAADLYWQAGETNNATRAFGYLRAISARFDLDTPLLKRLSPIAEHLGLPADWRVEPAQHDDVGERPPLDSLGPFRWQPYDAPTWRLKDADHKSRSLADYKGRPVLVVFYLGYGCSHCIEQLNLMAPVAKEFEDLGIDIVAIGTDTEDGLHKTSEQARKDGGFPFPLLSDSAMNAFRAYRAYDDFEHMPLHGTFLVDGLGKVRWQDISYEPFTDIRFLVSESKRLLGLSRTHLAAAVGPTGGAKATEVRRSAPSR